MVVFGLPVLFMLLGLLEMALREKGRIPRARNFGFKPDKDLTTEPAPLKR
jgi:hypothetical protein